MWANWRGVKTLRQGLCILVVCTLLCFPTFARSANSLFDSLSLPVFLSRFRVMNSQPWRPSDRLAVRLMLVWLYWMCCEGERKAKALAVVWAQCCVRRDFRGEMVDWERWRSSRRCGLSLRGFFSFFFLLKFLLFFFFFSVCFWWGLAKGCVCVCQRQRLCSFFCDETFYTPWRSDDWQFDLMLSLCAAKRQCKYVCVCVLTLAFVVVSVFCFCLLLFWIVELWF